MSRLIRLYPAAWRARYEEEFLVLLAERRPSIRDRIDIVAGAVDARLRPQVSAATRTAMPLPHRLPGLAALIAGSLFSIGYLGILLDPGWESVGGSLIGTSFLLGFLSLPGTYFERYARQLKAGFALGVPSLLSAAILPWPLLNVPVLVVFSLVIAGSLALAAARAGVPAKARWVLVGLVIVLPAVLGTPVLVMGLPADRTTGVALGVAAVLPYGLAWVAIGARMAARGAPTFLPASPRLPPLEDHLP